MEQTQNTRVIDLLVAAYNSQDVEAFANLFTEDAVHGVLHSPTSQRSRKEIYERYVEVFKQYPENKTEVVHRIAFGDFVIDHEKVRRSSTTEPFDVVAIYKLESGLIARLEFVRS
jgi:uncharacterized protein (TIGR02246 family)